MSMYTYSEARLCPVCDSENRRLRYTYQYLNLVRLEITKCLSCGTYYVPRPLAEEFLAKYYEAYYKIDGPLQGNPLIIARDTISAEKRRNTFLANLPPAFNHWGTWLDVGCGSGAMLKNMGNLFEHSIGIEPSEASVKFATSTLGLKVKHGFLLEGSFPHASFDLITFFDVLEHVINPKHLLLVASRLLKPEGWVLITTVNMHSFYRTISGKYWRFFTPLQHLTYFHSDALIMVLESCSFHNFTVYSSTREDIHPAVPLINILKAKAIYNEIHSIEEARLAHVLGKSEGEILIQQTPFNQKINNARSRSFYKMIIGVIASPIEQLVGVVTNLIGRTDGLWVWAQKK
ncbi:MAG: class I SAM-dependent methyltransferase [Thermodesulfobacteriota bacterium]